MTGEVEQNLQSRCHDKRWAPLIIKDVTRRLVRVRESVRESLGNLYSYISASSRTASE